MNGIRFYHEFTNTRKRQSAGTIVAACVCNGVFFSTGKACYEAFVGVFDQPDSPVNFSAVSLDYLRTRCKRVSERQAREIHPRLFERLEQKP